MKLYAYVDIVLHEGDDKDYYEIITDRVYYHRQRCVVSAYQYLENLLALAQSKDQRTKYDYEISESGDLITLRCWPIGTSKGWAKNVIQIIELELDTANE
jgi:hypothetical protein